MLFIMILETEFCLRLLKARSTRTLLDIGNWQSEPSQLQALPDWLHHTTAGPSLSPVLPH